MIPHSRMPRNLMQSECAVMARLKVRYLQCGIVVDGIYQYLFIPVLLAVDSFKSMCRRPHGNTQFLIFHSKMIAFFTSFLWVAIIYIFWAPIHNFLVTKLNLASTISTGGY